MNWTLSKLKREDWDFSKCLTDSLWACHRYEYQREDESLVKSVLAYRKQNPNFPQKYLETLKPYDPEKFQGVIGAFGIGREIRLPHEASLHPDWPEQSFLSPIGKPKMQPIIYRGKRSRMLRLDEIPLESLVEYWNENDGSFGKGGTIWNSEYASETRAFKISWRYSDADLVDGFADWIKENRPRGDEWDYRPKIEILTSRTGGASDGRNLKPELKALGAYRLLRCYNQNRQRAKAHSDDILKVLGKNFAHDSAWTEAKDLALKTIKNFDAPFDFTKNRLKPNSK
jgi:hypothetical protein